MKKLIVFLSFIVMSLGSAYAQQGEQAIGVNISYGSEIESLGFGAKYRYNIFDPFRVEGSCDYFLKKNNMKMWDLNINAHYLFPVVDDLTLYPLAGFTYAKYTTDLDYVWGFFSGSNFTRCGINLGGGVDYAIADNLALNGELKYQLVSDVDQIVFTFGITYKF